jgi:solute carrier family 25 carnitine/acylcarnitine transporter 20/29
MSAGSGRLQAQQQLTDSGVVNNLRKIAGSSKLGEFPLGKKLQSLRNSGFVDLAAGTTGGVAQVFVGFPFDTMKTTMQASSQHISPMAATKQILERQGLFRGFYSGMSAPLVMVASQNAILFSVTGSMKRLLRPDGGVLTPTEAAFSGAVAGIPSALVATPTELLKCRLQAQGLSRPLPSTTPATAPAGKVLFTGPLDAVKRIMRTEGGFLGLCRGFTPTLTREIIGNASYFGAYSLAKTKFAAQGLESSRSLGTGSLMVCGGIAGAAFWLPIIPADTIKSRMQISKAHSTMMECARQIIKQEGFSSLFKGWQPILARSVPANAALFVAMEATHSFLSPV